MHSEQHRTRTLWLAGILHAFTHTYHVALLPLYLLIQADLKLTSVEQATLLVTTMMLSYFVPSYALGVLADRVSRKRLLGIGLAINGLGFVGLSLAPNYPMALACAAIAGIGGSFYHPAATAMVARLFPTGTGKALGLVGIGAGVGFFFGPIYTGWRVASLEPLLGAAAWRKPILELGVLGILMAIIFAWLAEEKPADQHAPKPHGHVDKMFPTPALWLFFIAASLAFGLRDFTGAAMGSLGSLFFQKAHGFDAKFTGFALSGIFLAASISNPVFGNLSDRGRFRWTSFALICAAVIIVIFPRLPVQWSVLMLMAYGFFFMGSYPMVEAALMESVPDAVRGRVFGFFITVGGLIGNLSHWAMGRLVKRMGTGAESPESYYSIYTVLSALVVLSLLGLPCLFAIRKREHALEHPAAPETGAPKTEPV
ncbi:MAG: MFS transporter [Verrucomicrobiota bacterium]